MNYKGILDGNTYSKFKKMTKAVLKNTNREITSVLKKYTIQESPFSAIDILNSKNRSLLFCFLFFFSVAICGYLSVMILSTPYRDDCYRYFCNSHVGAIEALRILGFLGEHLFFLSQTVTDAAPFTQILSCAILAYAACVVLKTLKIDTLNKWEVLCFTSVVVNPYLLEIMLYRFDNFFITLSLLLVSIAAYLSSLNKSNYFITQSMLLFLSLFIYQVAIAIYLIVFMYKFIEKIRSGSKCIHALYTMKYWFGTLGIVACAYIPFLQLLNYCKSEDGSVLALPYNLENISIIIHNVHSYFFTLYNDWSPNIIGSIFLIMISIFIIGSLIRTAKMTQSILAILMVSLLLCVLFLCPSGLYVCLKAFAKDELVTPRLLCGIGVLISIICHEVNLLMRQCKITDFLIKAVLCLTVIWNLMFLNSSINIMRENFRIRNLIEYDIAKDIFEIRKTHPNISHIGIIGEIKSQNTENFFNLYPIMNRIFLEEFPAFAYYRLGSMNMDIKNALTKKGRVFTKNPKYHSKQLIKEQAIYDVYILDNYILQFVVKEYEDNNKYSNWIMKIGEKM